MSRVAGHPASVTGHAVVRTKTGNTFVGHATYDGRGVTINGSLRVIVNGIVEHRPRPPRTIPLHLVREILWDEE